MPRLQPSQSYQSLRNYTEKWQWRDPITRKMTVGYNPPQTATDISRVPYRIKYVTLSGKVEDGKVVTLKVNLRRHQRMVQFTESQEIRWINDYLVIEVDGTRII